MFSRGGGFKYFLESPLFGEDSHFDSYFSTGLVQPPARFFLLGVIQVGVLASRHKFGALWSLRKMIKVPDAEMDKDGVGVAVCNRCRLGFSTPFFPAEKPNGGFCRLK